HEKERVCARGNAQHPHVAHSRTRLRCTDLRIRRGARRADQLSGPESRRRPRVAFQLARRAHAMAARDPVAGWTGLETWSPGTVDAVPDGGGILPGGHSPRSYLDLPG